MKKVLMVAAKPNMIQKFNHRNIRMLQNMGFEVHVATNVIEFGSVSTDEIHRFKTWLSDNNVILHQVDFGRKLGTFSSNYRSLKQLDKLFKQNNFNFIHVHSPLGSILGRLVSLKYKVPSMYTAHGFHFLKQGPLSAWLVFFPLEWGFSFITDTLITINDDDYAIAKKYMHARKIEKINGIGVDVYSAKNISIEEKRNSRKKIRQELNIPENAFLISSVGELNDNKNQKIVLEAISKLPDSIKKNVYYIVAGVGDNDKKLENIARKVGVGNKFKLLGYRTDVHDINFASDVSVFPSFREGLGIAGLDAVVDGTYLLGSDVRGIKDYIFNDSIGKVFDPHDSDTLVECIKYVFENPKKMDRDDDLLLTFDTRNVDNNMEKFYKEISNNN